MVDMNVILDTNTLVAAGFNPRSNSAKIVKGIEEGTINLVWNQATKRESQRMISQIPRLSWESFSPLFSDENEYKEQTSTDHYGFIEDPDDRKFAALGEATNSIVVTNDRHLLAQRARLTSPVMTPHEFSTRYADVLR
jgi:predicted nucleic acid-binding protein